MQASNDQKVFWDKESEATGYCEKQLENLRKMAVLEMIDAALIVSKIQPKRILEIGGGSQVVSRHLCDVFPDAEVICSDISEERVQEFNKYYEESPPNLLTMGGVNAESLPFENDAFDLVVGDAMLHHIDRLKPALFEIKRILSAKGRAIFVREPVIGLFGVWVYRLLQMMDRDSEHIHKNYYEYKRMLSQWQYELMMAGFNIRLLKRWKTQSINWKFRCLMPHLTPCYIGFILTPGNSLAGDESQHQ